MAATDANEYEMRKENQGANIEEKAKPVKNQGSLVYKVVVLIVIIVLSTSTVFLYQDNQSLKATLSEQTVKTARLQLFILGSNALADSNSPPPISKLQAVNMVLEKEHYNLTSLSDLRVNASLRYYEHNYARAVGLE